MPRIDYMSDQRELDLQKYNNVEYVLKHAPNTIDPVYIGIDTLARIKKLIENEWDEEDNSVDVQK
jgi:hypothetical protein|tara:strand:+ start:806 stop:1000 length:195 start_codon:yes stop_codon:yes gene_type:complete